jgi:hypothetical protein
VFAGSNEPCYTNLGRRQATAATGLFRENVAGRPRKQSGAVPFVDLPGVEARKETSRGRDGAHHPISNRRSHPAPPLFWSSSTIIPSTLPAGSQKRNPRRLPSCPPPYLDEDQEDKGDFLRTDNGPPQRAQPIAICRYDVMEVWYYIALEQGDIWTRPPKFYPRIIGLHARWGPPAHGMTSGRDLTVPYPYPTSIKAFQPCAYAMQHRPADQNVPGRALSDHTTCKKTVTGTPLCYHFRG